MYQPQSVYTEIALNTILKHLNYDSKVSESFQIPNEIYSHRRGCFVSIHNSDGSLRGCIGTIEPQEKNVHDEIVRNAISAAFHDSRFHSLNVDELNTIELSVDILTEPDQIYSLDDLDPLIYGVIVTDGTYRRAVLLPAIPGINTIDNQIDIVKKKAGLSRFANSELNFYRFTSNRYH